MKKSIFTIAALLFAVVTSAQTLSAASAEERAKSSADHMNNVLKLDVKQYNKVYKAYLKLVRREDKRMSQSAADRKAAESAIKDVLTPQQAQRFEQVNDKLLTPPTVKTPTGREPLTREPKIAPLKRDPRRSNMYIKVE